MWLNICRQHSFVIVHKSAKNDVSRSNRLFPAYLSIDGHTDVRTDGRYVRTTP